MNTNNLELITGSRKRHLYVNFHRHTDKRKMLLEILVVSSILLCCILLCSWITRRHKLPPGPTGYPVCGNSFQIDTDRIQHDLKNLCDKYGMIFQLKIMGTRVVTLTSSRLLKYAFCLSPCEKHTNDRSENSTSEVFYGRKHIGCANYSNITEFLREFHSSGIQHFLLGKYAFETAYELEIKKLHLTLIGSPGKDINPHQSLRTYFQNLCSVLLIGETLPDSDPDKNILWEFIDLLYTMVDPSVDGPLRMFPYLRLLPGYYGNIYRETLAARDKVAKKYFDDQKSTYEPGKIRGLVDICLMTQAQQKEKDGETWLSDEYIKGLIFDTLAAGMTELMKFLRLFILLMCHHQDVQARLQTEIDRAIGTERPPTAHHRHCMPYAEAVRLEVLRFGSQTPLAIPHLCNKDVVVDGYLIPEGTVIFPNLYGVHHDEDVWGDPWVFRPDRFLNESGALLPNNHKFMENVIPFGIGKRACPGRQFAEARIFIGMTSLLQRMRFLPPEHSELPSADPRLYSKRYPLLEPEFDCKVVTRENIII